MEESPAQMTAVTLKRSNVCIITKSSPLKRMKVKSKEWSKDINKIEGGKALHKFNQSVPNTNLNVSLDSKEHDLPVGGTPNNEYRV